MVGYLRKDTGLSIQVNAVGFFVEGILLFSCNECNGPSKPVSRVLYPSQVKDGDHLSSPSVTGRVKRPTRGQAGRPYVPLFGLAPDGVCPAGWSPSRW